jgi:hypothetical protein
MMLIFQTLRSHDDDDVDILFLTARVFLLYFSRAVPDNRVVTNDPSFSLGASSLILKSLFGVVESSCLDEARNDDLIGCVWFDLTEFVTYQASEV